MSKNQPEYSADDLSEQLKNDLKIPCHSSGNLIVFHTQKIL